MVLNVRASAAILSHCDLEKFRQTAADGAGIIRCCSLSSAWRAHDVRLPGLIREEIQARESLPNANAVLFSGLTLPQCAGALPHHLR